MKPSHSIDTHSPSCFSSVSHGTRMIKTVACLKPCKPSFFLCWALCVLRLQWSMPPKPKTVTLLVCVMISLSAVKRSAESTVCTVFLGAPYMVGNAKGNVPRSGEDGGARVQACKRP